MLLIFLRSSSTMDVPPFYMFEFPFENGYFSTQSTKIQQTLP